MKHKKSTEYHIYTIKQGDTLESIAFVLGERKDNIERFHNMYAKQNEIINSEIPPNLKHLYVNLQFSINEPESNKTQKVDFIYDAKIDLKPSKKTLRYDVDYELSVGDKLIQLTYQMGVAFIEKNQNGFLFEINKPNPFEEVDDFEIMQELDAKVLDTIYPLEVFVNDLGFCTGIANYKTIKERWQFVKTSTLDEFEGQNAIDNLNFYDSCFENEAQFNKLLENDVFLNTYFGGLHTNYTKGFNFENTSQFPIIQNVKRANYKIYNYIEPNLNEAHLVCIERMGTLLDERAKLDFEDNLNEPYYSLVDQDSPRAEGVFYAKYTLDNKTHTINTAQLECTIALDSPRKIKCKIQLLSNL